MTPQERLAWQAELDSAMAEVDSRLQYPRGKPPDRGAQPVLPQLGEVNLSPELLDELASRIAERLRPAPIVAGEATPPVAPARAERASRPVPVPAPPPAEPALRPGKMLMIRYRWPSIRLPWPFRLLQRRRKRHPLTVRAA